MIRFKVSTRVVVITKYKVYKIPIDYRGWLQGINERIIWDKYQDLYCLAPLIWSFGGIVCMQRVEPVEKISNEMVMSVKRLITPLNIPYCDLYNPENWGKHFGKIVLLDYGINERISKMY